MFRVRPPANRNDALQKKNLIDTVPGYVLCKQEHSNVDKVLCLYVFCFVFLGVNMMIGM